MKMIQRIKGWIAAEIGKAGVAVVKRKSPILKEVLENPDNLKIEAYFESDEIIVTIKKRED